MLTTLPCAQTVLTNLFQPGCSSLEGLLQENGPFLWQDGTYAPIENPYGWNRLTNVIYVDQPVGTGFSQGTPTAQNEVDVANQFMEFWKNFVDTFDLTGYKVYVVGESYAGMYVPYIASGMLDTNDTDYFNVSDTCVSTNLGRCSLRSVRSLVAACCPSSSAHQIDLVP